MNPRTRPSAAGSRASEIPTVPRVVRIVTYGGLGDALLLTPCLRELKRRAPSSKIIIHYLKRFHRDALLHNPNIDDLRPFTVYAFWLRKYGKRFADSRYGRILRYTSKFQSIDYGLANPCGMYQQRHASEIMAELLGVELTSRAPELHLTNDEVREGRDRVARLPRPIVAIHAVTSKPIKDWPLDRWKALMARFPACTFVQVGEPGDPLVEGAVDLRLELVRHSFAAIRAADYFVGCDSSMAHVAAAFSIPRVVIFGPATPAIWGHADSRNIYLNLHCSPCVDHLRKERCPFGGPCIDGITITMVADAVRKMLASPPSI
jgi:ADP-heptose:LPS heptosyltransferase